LRRPADEEEEARAVPATPPSTEAEPLRIETPMSTVTEIAADTDDGDVVLEGVDAHAVASRKAERRWMARIAVVVVAIAAALAFAHRQRAAREAAAPAATVPIAAAGNGVAPPNTAVTDGPAATAIPSGMGLLRTANAPPGHRIFVDGRVAGQTPQAVLVKCGIANVRIGTGGHRQTIDVPCGQELSLERP
jgi:hypothetical protein